MVVRNPVTWRWSHARHHTDTIIVGRDPEITVMRPPDIAMKALAFIGLPDVFRHFAILVRNAMGRFGPDERDYIPESELPRAILWAQVYVAVHVAAILRQGLRHSGRTPRGTAHQRRPRRLARTPPGRCCGARERYGGGSRRSRDSPSAKRPPVCFC